MCKDKGSGLCNVAEAICGLSTRGAMIMAGRKCDVLKENQWDICNMMGSSTKILTKWRSKMGLSVLTFWRELVGCNFWVPRVSLMQFKPEPPGINIGQWP